MTVSPNNALGREGQMLISACEYHPDLGFVGMGNGVPETEQEARKFAARAHNPGHHGLSTNQDQLPSLRSMRLLTTDSPETDIRISGFVLPAFLNEEMRAARLRLLVGSSVPSTPQALRPVADRLVECSSQVMGSSRLEDIMDDDEADFTDTDALLEYLLRDSKPKGGKSDPDGDHSSTDPSPRRLATKICTIELCVDKDPLSPNTSPRFGRHSYTGPAPGPASRSQSPTLRRPAHNGSTSPVGGRHSPTTRSPGRLRSPARSPGRGGAGGFSEPELLELHAPSKFAASGRERIRMDSTTAMAMASAQAGAAGAAPGSSESRRMSLPTKAYAQSTRPRGLSPLKCHYYGLGMATPASRVLGEDINSGVVGKGMIDNTTGMCTRDPSLGPAEVLVQHRPAHPYGPSLYYCTPQQVSKMGSSRHFVEVFGAPQSPPSPVLSRLQPGGGGVLGGGGGGVLGGPGTSSAASKVTAVAVGSGAAAVAAVQRNRESLKGAPGGAGSSPTSPSGAAAAAKK